ncbi:MAG TPA: DUF6132 family protein [Chitinophagales bacterium]|nr:DUF6132 family protein [Chitinophagales bacterium]HMW12575.1 DUF6132 family protein [Chitinophagales bacterium]HMX59839.1 DUF6132 family protein [Chitinophagales bacterium]HMY22864.1 DUF6132 family protein [Chitinophagales bacterium]HMZ33474.1 DUF6132 family protein [Chitinophagales bacterium]
MITLIKKYKLTLIGVVLGAMAGYAYYYYVGCLSGTCAITSNPWNSILYGALMGGLFFNIFQEKKEEMKAFENKETHSDK